MRTEAETNRRFREAQNLTNQNLEIRLEKIEQVMKNKKLDHEDFPPLSVWNLEKAKVNKVLEKQQELDEAVHQQSEAVKQQTEVQKEQKRRDDKEKNLIAYAIPEELEDQTSQMKADYLAIKHLYLNRVNLEKTDIIQISRVGNKKKDMIRPVRITFSSAQKRVEILRNNKNLKLENENLEPCAAPFCDDKTKHKHIYITTDKTLQQREAENKLRDELKRRRDAGEENLIIRGNKITKKDEPTHARWNDLLKDGW